MRVDRGISQLHLLDLLNYTSTDKLIGLYTSDRTRFKNKQTYCEWANKGRVIYTLPNKDESLGGIIWFGEKRILPGYAITFAIRLYEGSRGQGLALPFMEDAFNKFYGTEMYQQTRDKGIWLEVKTSNEVAIKTYERFGFSRIASDEKRVVMVYDQP